MTESSRGIRRGQFGLFLILGSFVCVMSLAQA